MFEEIEDFRATFLLDFTEELIRNSSQDTIEELKKLLMEKSKERRMQMDTDLQEIYDEREKFREKIRRLLEEKKHEENEIVRQVERRAVVVDKEPVFEIINRPVFRIPTQQPIVLRIPRSKLPEHLQYLKPIPHFSPLDLGKINSLINDTAVKAIECNGPDTLVIVLTNKRQNTNMSLSAEEINNIIDTFAMNAKIPINEGLNRIFVGNLMLSAIVSEIVGTKFIIKKHTDFVKPNQQAPMPRGKF